MIETFRNIFKIHDLRQRILFTVTILALERIGTHIVTPGIDTEILAEGMRNLSGTLFGLYDLFAGGAFSKAAVFGLGIMPYISASIILQLLGAVVPYIQRLQKEGEEGRKKITQYTRYGTLLISAMQAFGVAVFLESIDVNGVKAVINPGMSFRILTMISMSTGTILIMWLGELISLVLLLDFRLRLSKNGFSLVVVIARS